MSRIFTIARHDFRHALQDRLVWGAVLLLGVMFLPSVGTVSPGQSGALWEHVISMMADLVPFSLVVFAAVGYNSITGERAEGITRMVLGLGGTRRDIVLGKFISRLSIVILALGLVLIVACIQTVQTFGMRSLVPFWVMGSWMLMYGIVWTAITIGYSAAFSSQYRTLGALVITYALFSPPFWETLVHPLFAFVYTGSFSLPFFESLAEAPSWIHLMLRLNPLQGFGGIVQWSVAMTTGETPVIGLRYNLIGITMFIAVGVAALVVGVNRFERADLDDEKSGPGWSTRLLPSVRSMTVINGVDSLGVSTGGQSRVETIFRGDLNRGLKNWVVQGVVVVFILVIIPDVVTTIEVNRDGIFPPTLTHTLQYTFFLPVLVLGTAIGYQSIAGEREAETVRYALGLPSTRRDLVVGKLIARLGISIGAIVVVLLITAAVVAARLGAHHILLLLVAAVWILLLGVVWTTFVVGVSAAVSSGYRALAVILGVYLLCSTDNGLWGSIIRPLIGGVFTGQFSPPKSVHTPEEIGPVWFRYIDGLNPFVALRNLLQAFDTVAGIHPSNMTVLLVLYSVLVIFVFAGGTLYVGYRRFNQADLG